MTKAHKTMQPADNDDTEARIFRAFCEQGWILPRTNEDVARVEAEMLRNPVVLPASLHDATEVFARYSNVTIGPQSCASETARSVQENLARAAREGGDIPPDVEVRMRFDRDAAERRSKPDG